MVKLDHKTRLEIVRLYKNGVTKKEIMSTLSIEGHSVTRHNVDYWIRAYQNGRFDGEMVNGETSAKWFKVVSEADADIIRESFEKDPYLSATDIHKRLKSAGAELSLSTTQRAVSAAGYTHTQPRYAQMIRDNNKVKRTDFCKRLVDNNDNFDEYLFSDESTVQLHDNKATCYRKTDSRNKPVPKPKHPLKLHVWGAISRRGASKLLIFKGIMESVFYTEAILKDHLLPFIRQTFPVSHKFQQDNDPKHTSKRAKAFMAENGINWVPWPAESPDLNPIEMVWNQMKRHLVKVGPKTEEELKVAIDTFWEEHITVEVCNTYIDHLFKAVPTIVFRVAQINVGHTYTVRWGGKSGQVDEAVVIAQGNESHVRAVMRERTELTTTTIATVPKKAPKRKKTVMPTSEVDETVKTAPAKRMKAATSAAKAKVDESQVLKSIDRAIEAIHYQAVRDGDHYSNKHRENLQQLIQHRKTVCQSCHDQTSQGQVSSPTDGGPSKTRSVRRKAPAPPLNPQGQVAGDGEVGREADHVSKVKDTETVDGAVLEKDTATGIHKENQSNHTDTASSGHSINDLMADSATCHIQAGVDCATSPMPSPMKHKTSSSEQESLNHCGLVDVNTIQLPSTIGVELIEEVRRNTGLSYEKSGVAIETVLGHLGCRVAEIAPLLDRVFAILHEQPPVKQGEEETSQDYQRLCHIFEELATCKDDSQQRGWHLHEDEDIIANNLADLLSIMENAKQSVSQKAIARESYECVHNLVQYYQMETRIRLRLLLLRVFGSMCSLDSIVISMLLCSILTTELAEEIQTNIDDVSRVSHVALVLTMLFATGESVPANLHDHLNGKFIHFLLGTIENPPSADHDDEVSDLLVNLVLAFNLHFPTPDDNIVMNAVSEKRTVKVLTEKILLLFNRDEDPVHMFEYEPRPPDSVMKFLQDLYSRTDTSSVLYTNDARVLIDIVLRHLIDLSPGDKVRTSHLQLMQLILKNSDYVDHRHRLTELNECLHRILAEEDGTQADKDIVTLIFSHTDLFNT